MITSTMLGIQPEKLHTTPWSDEEKYHVYSDGVWLALVYERLKGGLHLLCLPGYAPETSAYLQEMGWVVIPPQKKRSRSSPA